MLSRGLGGLEQSLLDYAKGLRRAGADVTPVVRPRWPGLRELEETALPFRTCASLGEWDPFAAARLATLIREVEADVVISIGRRATQIVRRALRRDGPVHVARTPNYRVNHLVAVDHVIATTQDLARAVTRAGKPEDQVSIVPNSIEIPDGIELRAPDGHIPVIGALGRFVAKKGFSELLAALALLRDRGYAFEARIGGDGEEREVLEARARELGLLDRLIFPGWISDRRRFFEPLDIFCVPSLHEPFGIVVLEGLAHGRPMVVTATEGPREIASDGIDALMVPPGDINGLASALATLLDDPRLRHRLATAGLETARTRYAQDVVGARLLSVLEQVIAARAGLAAA